METLSPHWSPLEPIGTPMTSLNDRLGIPSCTQITKLHGIAPFLARSHISSRFAYKTAGWTRSVVFALSRSKMYGRVVDADVDPSAECSKPNADDRS